MGKWQRGGAAIAGGLLVLCILAGSGGSGGSTANKTIKICTELPVSGADAISGKPAQNGVTRAVKQANANKSIPGYTIVQANYDDVGATGTHDPTTGANNFRDAVDHALIAGCIGPFDSYVAQAEMPITNQAPWR